MKKKINKWPLTKSEKGERLLAGSKILALECYAVNSRVNKVY